jgi:hypothetical protein
MSGEAREPSDLKKGLGSGAVFVARNKFAVLDKARQVSSCSLARRQHGDSHTHAY